MSKFDEPTSELSVKGLHYVPAIELDYNNIEFKKRVLRAWWSFLFYDPSAFPQLTIFYSKLTFDLYIDV